MAKKSIHDLQLDIENEEHYLSFLRSTIKDCSSDIQRGIVGEQISMSKKKLNQLKHLLKVRTNSIEYQPLVFPIFEALDSYETEMLQGITTSPLTKEQRQAELDNQAN